MWNAESDPADVDFVYADADSPENEIAELYSYSEEGDFQDNLEAFESILRNHSLSLKWVQTNEEKNQAKEVSKWVEMNEEKKNQVIEIICDMIDQTDEKKRWTGISALLYLVQGCFGDCTIIAEQYKMARENVFRLYRKGVFVTCVQLLHWEIQQEMNPSSKPPNMEVKKPQNIPQNIEVKKHPNTEINEEKKVTVTIGDSVRVRKILSIIYTFIEVMRVTDPSDSEREGRVRCEFKEDLGKPVNNELLAMTLFQMASKYCSGSAATFPIRKILLVLWKTLLVSLGGTDEVKGLKTEYRAEMNLPPEPDDTHEVVKTMRPSSPPINTNEVLEAQNQRKTNRPFKRQMFVKQSSVAGPDGDNGSNGSNGENRSSNPESRGEDDDMADEGLGTEEIDSKQEEDEEGRPSSPRPATPTPDSFVRVEEADVSLPHLNRGLPWVTKVRYKEMDSFMDQTRSKFLGYVLPGNDRSTSAGLPEPILEGMRVLQSYIYQSLSEVQMEREIQLLRYPLTVKETSLRDDQLIKSLSSPTELLYSSLLPSLSQYMIALLKILLAAAPTSRAKNESINIIADVVPEQMPSPVLDSMKLAIDISRHKEIIIKSISAILFLLLKHLKINHVYQFEHICQQLMFANCIPLVLKFFNQNICSYVTSKQSISVIDFPACVIGQQPELTTENLEVCCDGSNYCWRNMFSCINLVRILNKLTKWKHSRIMMLVVFKSAPILKRGLKVRHAMLQVYILKLLKMQAKYLGRQWRKSNMKTMSAIYQKVRHRLTDDWAFGNDLDARPWDFQAEEVALQVNINRFHFRRYGRSSNDNHPPPPLPGQSPLDLFLDADLMTPVDNNLQSVLNSKSFQLTPYFKRNYRSWLDQEVFGATIDWDQLLHLGSSDM